MRNNIKMAKGLLFLLVIIFVITPLVSRGAILRNLKIGDRGEDVRELQQILNKNLATKVANTSYGSPGNETTYFGNLTHSAVLRFQNLYSKDILAPLGLTYATGFVGPSTRAFISNKLSQNNETSYVPPTTSTPVISKKPVINSVVPAIITKVDEGVVILGENFTTSGNSILFSKNNPNSFKNISSSDGKTLYIEYHFLAADIFRQQLAEARNEGIYMEVVNALLDNIQERVSGSDRALIPILLAVRNSNGESESFQVLIDVSTILTNLYN